MNEITVTSEAGRPLKIQSVEELELKVNDYFKDCDENKRPYTLSGLAFFLDVDRKTLLNYSNREAFFPTISRAKAKCEVYSAELLLKREGSTKGVEFNLSNNHGWRDSQNIDVNVGRQEQDLKEIPDNQLEEEFFFEVVRRRPELLQKAKLIEE